MVNLRVNEPWDLRSLVPVGDKKHHYMFGDWEIYPSAVSYHPFTDWGFHHKDYDGAEDANDWRYGTGSDPWACTREIINLEAEHA